MSMVTAVLTAVDTPIFSPNRTNDVPNNRGSIYYSIMSNVLCIPFCDDVHLVSESPNCSMRILYEPKKEVVRTCTYNYMIVYITIYVAIHNYLRTWLYITIYVALLLLGKAPVLLTFDDIARSPAYALTT